MCLLIFFSCNKKESKIITKDYEIIEIKKGGNNLLEKIALSKVIPLSNMDSSAISSWSYVKKIFYLKNKFYLFDSKYMNILVFSNEGKYLYKIGKLGTKIGQFVNIQDMIYMPSRKSIRVLCNNPSKIIEYSLDGDFIKEYYQTFFASDFEIAGPDTYYFYTNGNHNKSSQNKEIMMTDSLLRIKARLFETKAGQKGSFASRGGLYKSENNNVYFNLPYENDIYELKDGDAYLRYKVDFGKDLNINAVNFDSTESYLTSKAMLSDKLFFAGDYIGLGYHTRGQSSFCLYNVNTKKNYTTSISDSPVQLLTQGVYYSGGQLIVMFNPRAKKNIIDAQKEKILTELPMMATALNPSSNNDHPYLLIFKIKK
jgi:hypothetical protein